HIGRRIEFLGQRRAPCLRQHVVMRQLVFRTAQRVAVGAAVAQPLRVVAVYLGGMAGAELDVIEAVIRQAQRVRRIARPFAAAFLIVDRVAAVFLLGLVVALWRRLVAL